MKKSILDRDRLSVLSGALVLGLALGRFIDVPVRSVALDVLGSPLGLNLSAATMMLLLSAGLGATAMESLVRSHPLAIGGQLTRTVMYWIMPALLVLGLAGWLMAFDRVGAWTAGIIVSAILVPLALAAEYANVDPADRERPAARWGERALIFLVAFLLFSRIYDLGARALVSGSAVFAVSALLAARYLWFEAGRLREAFLYGATIGLLLSLFAWAVNYWSLSAMQGGLLLLLLFYSLIGLIQQSLTGLFNRRMVVEYSIVLLVGLLIVILGLR